MREIKFRYFQDGSMYMNCVVGTNCMGNPIVVVDGWDSFHSITPDSVMQFTGITDTNGAEIYEGDIVESSAMLPSVVRFNDSEACFSFDDWPICDYLAENCGRTLKVIGNIHQNPELVQ